MLKEALTRVAVKLSRNVGDRRIIHALEWIVELLLQAHCACLVHNFTSTNARLCWPRHHRLPRGDRIARMQTSAIFALVSRIEVDRMVGAAPQNVRI